MALTWRHPHGVWVDARSRLLVRPQVAWRGSTTRRLRKNAPESPLTSTPLEPRCARSGRVRRTDARKLSADDATPMHDPPTRRGREGGCVEARTSSTHDSLQIALL